MRTEQLTVTKESPDARGVPGYLAFSVSVVTADGAATVRITGDLDCYTSPRLRSTLLELVGDGTRHVVIDVAGTQFVDSTGLSVLVGGLKRLREHGGTLVLKSPSSTTLRLLEITGLRTVFDVA